MNKEFVPYELAVKLKQLGFDEPCFGYYVEGELRGVNLGIEQLGGIKPYYQRFGFHTLSNHDIDNPNKIVVTAPTFSQCFKWFREMYKLNGILNHYPNTKEWDCSVHNLEWLGKELLEYIKTEDRTVKYLNYEEAELACLTKLIEILETKSE